MEEAMGFIMMYILLNGITSLRNYMKVNQLVPKLLLGDAH
jgi:hypothetical protein